MDRPESLIQTASHWRFFSQRPTEEKKGLRLKGSRGEPRVVVQSVGGVGGEILEGGGGGGGDDALTEGTTCERPPSIRRNNQSGSYGQAFVPGGKAFNRPPEET